MQKKTKKTKAKEKQRISKIINLRLATLMLLSFVLTLAALWLLQGRVSARQAEETLELNINDVKADIRNASDNNMVQLGETVSEAIQGMEEITVADLYDLCLDYEIDEIHVIDEKGIIQTSTIPAFLGFDMASGPQSAEFLCLLDGTTQSFVQAYGPITYDPEQERKFAGIALPQGGFLQIGYDVDLFQRDLEESVQSVTGNRHVGKNGFVIIADERGTIVSDRMGGLGEAISISGKGISFLNEHVDKTFRGTLYGEECNILCTKTEGYYIIAAMPLSEIDLNRKVSVTMITIMEAIVFIALFFLYYFLLKTLVIDNIKQINKDLNKISQGKLGVKVNVRGNKEFDELSTDINTTVNTLKKYIAEAEKRIEAELQLAKDIQQSALPTVFPPYPDHHEFDIWGGMQTAKEVGGDFFDFCLVGDQLIFLIADVSGKGIPAAMFMMTAKTLIRNLAMTGLSVDKVLTKANEQLCANNDAEMFITAWIGSLNIKTGLVTYSNAGHNPPLIRHMDGDYEYDKPVKGFVLAGMEGYEYKLGEFQLKPGDEIFLYTDGVTEATDKKGKLYGEARLRDCLNGTSRTEELETVCKTIKKDMDKFVGTAPQFDDITMLSLRYKGAKKMTELNIEATLDNIPAVTEFVDAELEKNNCPMKTQMQINIAIDELFSNIARYAYQPEVGPATVRVEVEKDPLSVIITFIDNGVPYNPLEKADPDTTLSAEERQIGGLGILLVKKSMDDVEYEYKNGQNILMIRKNLG